MYRERREAGFSRESVMESIYAKSRNNARTPMQRVSPDLCLYKGKPRGKLLIICNFFAEETDYPDPDEWQVMEFLLSNYLDNKKERSPEILRSHKDRMYCVKKTSAQLP